MGNGMEVGQPIFLTPVSRYLEVFSPSRRWRSKKFNV